ncbi:MAG TPA: bifunctional alpha/beta hydrolase/class I SAM-dependent methyltransferase [Cellvibrionaceae bacterium]
MTRIAQESVFTTSDNYPLFFRHWPARSKTAKGVIILFHRGHEHSGRVAHLVDELGLEDFAFYAWDARGHGRSPGVRGYSPSIGRSVRDMDEFVRFAASREGLALPDVAVIAQSVGAVLAATWVHDYAPNIRCLTLASPAFKVKLYVPFAVPGLKLQHRLRGNFFVNSYVKAKFLTHDEERIASYNSDPLITRPISVNILLGLYEAAERVVSDAGAIHVPTQMFISGSDWVVHKQPQQRFFQGLGSTIKELHHLPGFYHDTLGERDRAPAVAKITAFISARFAQAPAEPALLNAHLSGYSFDEFKRLQQPLPWYSPKRWQFAITKTTMQKLGARLSDGVKLGWETGFDSGSTLDYVYRNTASGRGFLGRIIDRNYLDAIGWRGIRERKAHVQQVLQGAIAQLQARKQPVHLVDIAAGHGRYDLEAIAPLTHKPDSMLLRDFSPLNVSQGQALIKSMGLQSIAQFVQGDAFDPASILSISPRPTLAVVSGLYELFPDNAIVQASLKALGEAVEPGGYLVYTGQPWHPQLEFIARVLASHRGGDAWVMRRRVQAEMDQLVTAAGFTKCYTLADDWGIFTVSLAQKNHD